MRRLLLGFALLAAACASPGADRPDVEVVVRAAADGEWIADYRFGAGSAIWVFPHSQRTDEGVAWRQRDWRVETVTCSACCTD